MPVGVVHGERAVGGCEREVGEGEQALREVEQREDEDSSGKLGGGEIGVSEGVCGHGGWRGDIVGLAGELGLGGGAWTGHHLVACARDPTG